MRHTAVGALIIGIAVWAFLSATFTFHQAVHVAWPLAAVAGLLVATVIVGLDIVLTATPLAKDSWGARLAVIATRGLVSVAMGLVIAHATILLMYASSIDQLVETRNQQAVAADTGKITKASPYSAQASAANEQIKTDNEKLAAADKALSDAQQELRRREQAWKEDRICVGNGSLAPNGDHCGPGPVSDQLQAAYNAYLKDDWPQAQRTHDQIVQQLNNDVSAQQETIKADQAALDKAIHDGTEADRQNTGLVAQSQALWTLLKHDSFAWLWVMFFIVIDLAVGFLKAVLPESDFDRRRRIERKRAEKLDQLAEDDPVWLQVAQHWAANEASVTMAHSDAKKDRELAAIRSGVPAHHPVGAGRAIRLGVASLVAVALFAAIAGTGSGNSHSVKATSPTTAGQPIRVQVDPAKALTVTVPDIGTLTAEQGSFDRPGIMTVSPARAVPPSGDGVTVTEPGVDVKFNGFKITKPLTLTLAAGVKPAAGAVPVLAHRADDGTWEYRLASIGTGGAVTAATNEFSFDVAGWLSDAGHWIGDHLASALAGRTPPLTCSGAPGWFHVAVGHSDLVHVCAKDAGKDGSGVDRAEIQIKSNRGVTVEVTVPGNPQYVWVEDQTWGERKWLMPKFGRDPNRSVLLPAGATMTIGYTQPPAPATYSFGVDGVTMLAVSDTLFRQLLGMLAGESPQTFVIYLEGACSTNFTISPLTGVDVGPNLGDVLRCVAEQATEILKHVTATDIARTFAETGADANATLSQLKGAAKKIPELAALVSLVPIIQLGWGNDIDEFKRIATGGAANQVTFTIDGGGATKQLKPIIIPGGPGGIQGSGGIAGHQPAPSPTTTAPTRVPTGPSTVQPHLYFDNYGPTSQGVPVCRGNPGRPESMPGGTVTQTFTADATGTINAAKVQIDPDSTVTATAVLVVSGSDMATATQPATGDVVFSFPSVPVVAGATIGLRISFTATYGKIITIYQAGNPGGTFGVANSCSDGAPTFTRTDTGLRAIMSGTA